MKYKKEWKRIIPCVRCRKRKWIIDGSMCDECIDKEAEIE